MMYATAGIYFLYTPLCPLPWRLSVCLSVCLLNHHRGGGVVWCNVTRGGGCRGRRQKFALFAWFIVIYVAHWFYINGTYVPTSHTESRMLRNDVRRCRRLRHILSLYTMMPSLSSLDDATSSQTGEGLCKNSKWQYSRYLQHRQCITLGAV